MPMMIYMIMIISSIYGGDEKKCLVGRNGMTFDKLYALPMPPIPTQYDLTNHPGYYSLDYI